MRAKLLSGAEVGLHYPPSAQELWSPRSLEGAEGSLCSVSAALQETTEHHFQPCQHRALQCSSALDAGCHSQLCQRGNCSETQQGTAGRHSQSPQQGTAMQISAQFLQGIILSFTSRGITVQLSKRCRAPFPVLPARGTAMQLCTGTAGHYSQFHHQRALQCSCLWPQGSILSLTRKGHHNAALHWDAGACRCA